MEKLPIFDKTHVVTHLKKFQIFDFITLFFFVYEGVFSF